MIFMVKDKAKMVAAYWFRTSMNDEYGSVSIRDVLGVVEIFHTSSILAQNSANINVENVRIWRRNAKNIQNNEVDRSQHHKWSYLDKWSGITKVENYLGDIKNVDLWSDINIMIEIMYDDGQWKRKCDEDEWRKRLGVGTKLDIYDRTYSKWYPGQIIEMNEDGKRVKVHYDGYSSNYDEYMDINSKFMTKYD